MINMKKINQFSLIEINELYSDLVFENNKIITISGKIIEYQFQYQGNYLLLITTDCPFEETLYIYYLNQNLHIIDSAEISQIYTGGILGDVKTNADTLTFTFFDNEDNWEIKILPQPIRAFSLGFGSPLKRPFSIGKLRYFDIQMINH